MIKKCLLSDINLFSIIRVASFQLIATQPGSECIKLEERQGVQEQTQTQTQAQE